MTANPTPNQTDSDELRAKAASIAAKYFMATSNDCVSLTDDIYKAFQAYAPAGAAKLRGLLADFAEEYDYPYRLMDNQSPPATQRFRARQMLIDEYVAKIATHNPEPAPVDDELLEVLSELSHAQWQLGHDGLISLSKHTLHALERIKALIAKPDAAAKNNERTGDANA